MPNGRLSRRTTPRLAQGVAVLTAAAVLAGTAGCQRFPLRYTEVAPESTSRATTRVESAEGGTTPPGEIGPLAATPLAGSTAPPSTEAPDAAPAATIAPVRDQPAAKPRTGYVSKSSAFPHLDEALRRAEGTSEKTDAAPEVPAAEPAASKDKADDAPLDLPPLKVTVADPAPAETAAVETRADGPTPIAFEPPPVETGPGPKPVETTGTEPPEPAGEALPDEPAPLEIPRVAELPVLQPEPKSEPEPRSEPKAKAEPESEPEPEPKAKSEPEPEPESERIDTAVTVKAPAARDEWREGLDRLREYSRKRAGAPGDASEAWAIRSRVLDWLAGEGPGPAGGNAGVWNSVLATLSAATGPETPDEAALAFHLGAAVDSLESFAPLQITALSYCRKISGFGHYDPVDAPAVRPGEPLLVYCEMAGLRYETDTDGFRSRLSSRVEIAPADGGKVVWSEELGTAEDVCRRRRRDYFVNYRIAVPAKLAPGSYSLRLSQTDLVSNRSVSSALPFTVKP